MNIKQILKQPINRVPVSAQFIKTIEPQKPILIKTLAGPQNYNDKDREKVELWLSMASIGTTILDTATRGLANMKLIHSRDGVFDLITAFKQLNKHFTGNEAYDKKEMDIDNFIFTFLTSGEEHQKRVMKFQESLLNKKR